MKDETQSSERRAASDEEEKAARSAISRVLEVATDATPGGMHQDVCVLLAASLTAQMFKTYGVPASAAKDMQPISTCLLNVAARQTYLAKEGEPGQAVLLVPPEKLEAVRKLLKEAGE